VESIMSGSSALIINVPELRKRPIDVELNEAPSCLDLEMESGEFISRVTGRLAWRWIDNKAVATGRLSTRIKASCSRCLRDVELTVAVDARLVYSGEPPAPAQVVEIGMDDEGVTHFKGDEIDANEDVRAILLLEVPERPLCSESCKGLCPQCGADLNEGPCRCVLADQPSPEKANWQAQIEALRKRL